MSDSKHNPQKIIEHPARDPVTGAVLTYTPGYVPHKIGMLFLCLLVLAMGGFKLFPALQLVVFGHRIAAEVTAIVRTQEGRPELTLNRDADWKPAEEQRDRSSVFWDVYRFTPPGGVPVTFRGPVGSLFRPLQPLLDADGLPTVVTVYYDPNNPQRVLLPLELSTWFFPATLTLFGIIGTGTSFLLLYYARKPIVLPHIAEAS
jgi:hypothetical protein